MRRALLCLVCATAACGGPALDVPAQAPSDDRTGATNVTVYVPPPPAAAEGRGRSPDDLGVAPALNAREAQALKEIDHQIDVALDAPGLIAPSPGYYGGGGLGMGTVGNVSIGSSSGGGSPSGGSPVSSASPRPTGDVQPALLATTAPLPANASAVVAGTRAGLKRCYHRALADDPTIRGSLTLTVSVQADGTVRSADVVPPDTLPAGLTSCARARFGVATFASTGAPVSFMVRLIFAPNPP